MPFFRFYPALYLGACAVHGANPVNDPCGRDMCIFPAIKTSTHIHLGFINTENEGQILYIVAHPFQQHFGKNKNEYYLDIPQSHSADHPTGP